MGDLSLNIWFLVTDRFTAKVTECVKCSSNPKISGNNWVFSCGGEKVEIPMFGFEDFDVERAQEVMDTLRDILDEDGIKWTDKSVQRKCDDVQFTLLRTHIIYHGKLYSVILGTGTYGFEDYKLELLSEVVNGGEPIGGLTVTKVIDILKNGYNPEV